MKTVEEVLYDNIKEQLTEGKKITTFEEWQQESMSEEHKDVTESIHKAMKAYAEQEVIAYIEQIKKLEDQLKLQV